ncbi:MAG: hypothetical protein IJB35_00690 [Oscillospiraceae bacterium]|nr:hypothetical protein [Oscillospiraceae bacterium]
MGSFFLRLMLSGMILLIITFVSYGATPEYEMFDCEGYVAVRRTETGEIRLFESRTKLLPPQDRALLKKGYPCEDELALARAMENFCS